MGEIFIGRDAVAGGAITRYTLQRWYKPVLPGVYMPKAAKVTLPDRSTAAFLWSKRGGVVAGAAASALHGAQWVDDHTPVELIWNCTRPPRGIVARNERVAEDEIMWVGRLPVTTPARTAFDLGRFLPRNQAVARMDALMRAYPFSVEDVLMLAKRYRGARGLHALRTALALVDGGAASPQETRLRLLYIEAGFPRPTTQIPVVEGRGRLVRMLDMGWEEFMVGSEYDGEQHQTSRWQYVKDRRVLPKVKRLGWNVISVIKEDSDDEIITRTYRAMKARGWRGELSPPRAKL